MPFNGTSKRLERIWAFVDQFIAGENAERADFDVVFNDVVNSTNDAVAYLEGLIAAINITDARFLGLKATAPTTRNDASALQDGDQYVSSAAADLGVIYVRNSGAWIRATDYTAPSTFFKTLLGAADAATLRGLIGLGSAATSASSAFATSAQGTKADAAVQAPGGIANTITDWNDVQTSGTGFYIGDAAAANTPTAHTYTGYYIKANATNGILMAFSPSTAVAYRRFYTAGVWGSWSEVPHGAALLELQALVRTRGDLVVGGASAWERLAIGAADQALYSNGTDAGWQTAYRCRAWVKFQVSAGTPSILASGNVASITDNGVGDYTVNFQTALPDANYAVAAMCSNSASNSSVVLFDSGNLPTASAYRFTARNANTGGALDPSIVSLVFFR
jgi:hypothetical protein